ncbi:MAG: lamin tail domain-containing protein [Planctomycetaceae bacterium]|nr:lamin tail domain-containing protein [Planctomycetaceae bacterium]
MKKLVSLLVLVLAVNSMATTIQITEWMYKGTNGEFVEFTNLGSTAIDMTGWSYSDSDAAAGDLDLSIFGIIAPGESVILTDADASAFRTAWGLSASVKILGSNTNSNLGRADEIHLYDASEAEIDLLIFSDAAGKGPRTENKSCTIPQADFASTTASSSWVLSSVGNNGSWASTSGDIGNPGYNNYTIPEPATIFILSAATMILRFRKR